MNRCPITYETCGSEQYSAKGLQLLHPKLSTLHPLPYSAEQQRLEAATRMQRMSIQGVQPKLSAVLDVSASKFDLVDVDGRYIIKPQSHIFQSVPELEDVSMRMAKVISIETPFHGLVYSKDGSLSYFIRRFDRIGKSKKVAVEDFAQLAGLSRTTKYRFSTEKMIAIIDAHCTFPVIEKTKFFRLLLFSFLIGNEDMHLKNFSLITRQQKVEFSPAYDLLNSTLAMGGAVEEMALPIAGKKSKLKRATFVKYLAEERLQLTTTIIKQELDSIKTALPEWKQLLDICFLSTDLKRAYWELIEERAKRMDLWSF
ncbi:MAG: HipA domain-containing protein [Bacteroidota bacterium]